MPWHDQSPVEMPLRRGSKGLTLRERSILLFVASHGPCTVREIGEGVGLRSSSTVHQYIQWFRRNGLIANVPNRSRTITLYPDVVVSEKGLIGWWAREPERES